MGKEGREGKGEKMGKGAGSEKRVDAREMGGRELGKCWGREE